MKLLLRLEHLAIALVALAIYWNGGTGWRLFLLLVLVPDLSMLGYAFGPRTGAMAYNIVHSFVAPALLLAVGYLAGWDLAVPVASIWVFHIAFDRMCGYGLKRTSGFHETHLGRIGGGRQNWGRSAFRQPVTK